MFCWSKTITTTKKRADYYLSASTQTLTAIPSMITNSSKLSLRCCTYIPRTPKNLFYLDYCIFTVKTHPYSNAVLR